MKFITEEDISTEEGWVQDKGYKKKVLLEDQAGGAVLQINIAEPRTTLPSHYHKSTKEWIYILSGEATLIINDKKFPMKPNELITIEPDEIHTVRNDSEKEFKYLVFKSNVEKGDKFEV